MVKAGRVKEEELVALVENAGFRTVQLELRAPEKGLAAWERLRFSARFMDALLKRYHPEGLVDRLGGADAKPVRACHEITSPIASNRSLTVAALKRIGAGPRGRPVRERLATVIS